MLVVLYLWQHGKGQREGGELAYGVRWVGEKKMKKMVASK